MCGYNALIEADNDHQDRLTIFQPLAIDLSLLELHHRKAPTPPEKG
jgi:hypothetical protein